MVYPHDEALLKASQSHFMVGETFYFDKFDENIIIESVEPRHVPDASVDEYFVFVKWYSLYAREFMFVEISEFNLKRA